MKRLLLATLPAALLVAAPMPGAGAFAQALSPAVGKPLQQASNSAKAGNNAAALNFVNQARQAAKTAAERTKVAQMAAYVHTRAGQYGQAATELERINAPASQLAPLYYQARQYDKAISAAQKSGQQTIVAQSYLMQGKAADAAKIYEQMLAKSPNNPTVLQNLAGAQFKMGDKKAYVDTVQKLIRVDPTPNRWRTLLVDAKAGKISRDAKLGIYHLMRETGALTNPNDVQEFAKIAIVAGQPGVAADAVKGAMDSGVVPADDAMTAKLVEAGNKRQSAALAQAGQQAKAPQTALQAGHAYLGAGQYPQAIAAYTAAQKGPNPGEAALFKGIAQVRAGDLTAAQASFDSVPEGPVSETASLWKLYATTKKA